MRGKILFLTGLGVGYLFGTKAGREKYDQISRTAASFWNDPRVQTRVDQVKEKAPEVAEFVTGNAKKAASTISGKKNDSSSSSPGSTSLS
jgi:hypothetical protein